jgi:DinB superfamily
MKNLAVAILAAALPLSLAAQQPANGAQPTDPIATAFRGRILSLHRNIAQAFDSIPESKFGYKPTPAQLTIGYIAQHVASDSYLFCNNFGAMKAKLSAKETETPDSVKAKWPKDTLVAQLKASFAFCQSALAQLHDSTIAEPVTLMFGGTARHTSRINMVLGHAMDLADHYSQIANYMRLNDMLPPSALPRRGRGGI